MGGWVSRVRAWIAEQPGSAAAVVLGMSAAILLAIAFGITLAIGIALSGAGLSGRFPIAAVWALCPLLLAVPLWLLVRWALDRGGWRGVGGSLGLISAIAVLSWAAGEIEQAVMPADDMAGIGFWIVSTLLLVLVLAIAMVAGIQTAVSRVRSREQPADD